LVPAGKKAVVVGNKIAVISNINATDSANTWFVYNNPAIKKSAPVIETITTTTKNIVPPITTSTNPTPAATETPLLPIPDTAPVPNITPIISTPTVTTPMATSSPAAPVIPAIILTSASPNSVLINSTTSITLTGEHFITAKVAAVIVGTTRITQFSVRSETSLIFTLNTKNILAGTYHITLEDAAGNLSMVRNALTVSRTR
jgi:hypothetical protein